MGKYIFTKDFSAKGTNVVPDGSAIANFILKYNFLKGDVFEGEYTAAATKPYMDKDAKGNLIQKYDSIPASVKIITNTALDINGKPVAVKAIFVIPMDVILLQATTTLTTTSTTIFTTKNIVIGLAFIAAVFGILKWQKVI